MATVALGVVGAVAGGIISGGNPGSIRLGFSLGVLAGGLVDQAKQKPQQVGRLSDLQITGSQYGTPIPWIWGTVKTGTTIAWWSDLKEVSRKKGSKLTGTRQKVYTYSVDLFGIVSHGPITAILKIWANDTLIYDSVAGLTPANITIKLGDATQSIITDMDDQQTGPVPAYRLRSGFYINDFDLTPYGNGMPQFTTLSQNTTSYERLVKTDGPVAYYRFEDTPGLLADSTNNHYDLSTLNGTVTQLNTSHGEGLQVTSGTSENARTVGVVGALQGQQLTVEGWFKYAGGVPTANGGFRVKYRSAYDLWHLNVEPSVLFSTIVVQWIVDPTLLGFYQTIHQYSFARDTNEHHIVVSYDRATGISNLYVDNVLVDTQTALAALGTGTAGSQIYLKTSENMRGDEVAIYDKALTAAQVSAHFTGSTTVRVSHILADIFQECGLSGDQYDVRDATDVVTGYAITDRSEARGAIEGLLAAYFTDLTEYDGRLVAIRRGGASQVTLDALDLGAELVEPGSDLEPKPVIVTRRLQELELPFGVDFAFISANNGYQQSSQRAIRYTKQHLQEQVTLSAPLVFTEDAARLIAERLLYQAWVERETFEISLPLTYLYLVPGDVITLPIGSSLLRCRIAEMTLGLPGAISCRLVLDDAAVLTQVVPGGAVNGPVVFVTPVTNTAFIAWNGNAGRDADADSIGLYVAANGATAGVWEGAVLFLSRDAGASYQELTTLADAGTFGTASSVLAAGTATELFDEVSTVDVLLTGGIDNPPVSRSDADLFGGLNGAVIGDEYIQFGTVTSLGGNSYRLAHLIRGRRGTDTFWDEHRTGERVAFDDGGITRVELDESLVNQQVMLKALGSGQVLADVSPVTVQVYGGEKLAYAPWNLSGTRDGSNNLTLNWLRRTRIRGEMENGSDVPLDFDLERYVTYPLPAAGTTITAITNAIQAVVTAAGHGLAVDDLVYFTGITGGMLPLNTMVATVVAVSGTSFTVDVDTRDFPAWTAGGTVRKPTRTISTTAHTASFTAAMATTDGLPPAGPVTFVIAQLNDESRRGYSLVGSL